jgi:hypothetical protein
VPPVPRHPSTRALPRDLGKQGSGGAIWSPVSQTDRSCHGLRPTSSVRQVRGCSSGRDPDRSRSGSTQRDRATGCRLSRRRRASTVADAAQRRRIAREGVERARGRTRFGRSRARGAGRNTQAGARGSVGRAGEGVLTPSRSRPTFRPEGAAP